MKRIMAGLIVGFLVGAGCSSLDFLSNGEEPDPVEEDTASTTDAGHPSCILACQIVSNPSWSCPFRYYHSQRTGGCYPRCSDCGDAECAGSDGHVGNCEGDSADWN